MSHPEPLVSIIVPIYNVARYLRECVDSLRAQTHAELEIILVDDGSTDGSGAICDEYAALDARVRVVRQPNRGVSAARNTGLDTATGKYVQFVDPDDWVEPTITEHLLREMRCAREDAHADVQLAICSPMFEYDNHAETFPLSDTFTPGIKEAKAFLRIPEPSDSPKYVEDVEFHACWGRLLVREIIAVNGLRFDEDLPRSEDSLFMMEYYSRIDRVVTTRERGYHYRRHAGSGCLMKSQPVRDRDFTNQRSFYSKCAKHLAVKPGLSEAERREELERFHDGYADAIVWYLFRFASHSSNAATLRKIRELCDQPELRRALRYYRLRTGHSRIVPLFLRMGAPRAVLVALRQHARRSKMSNHSRSTG